jgi:transposase
MGFAGIDVGKDACTATIITDTGRIRERLDFPNRPEGFNELAARLKPRDQLVMEAGTYVYPLHDHFTRLGRKVLVAHPRAIKQITESEKKTDAHDSLVLAQLARVGYLPMAYVPHPDILRNREILRSRLDMAYQSTRVKTRIRSFLAKQGLEPPEKLFDGQRTWLKRPHWKDSRDLVLGVMIDELEALEARRAKIDPVLATLATDSDEVKLLMSIPGIDYYLALMIVSEVGDVSRFQTREALRTYAGCAPKMRQSAGRNPAKGTNTTGSPRLKTAMSLAAQTAARFDNPIRDAFLKRFAKTQSKARSHAVARRKMCDLVYALLVRKESCSWANPASVERKLEKLETLNDSAPRLPTPP